MKNRLTIFLCIMTGGLSNGLLGQTLTGAHDPTVIKDDRCVYTLLTTNNLLQVRQSTNEINWNVAGNIFTGVPAWVNTALGTTIPDIWAPCIRYNNGLYWVYYACSSFGTNNSVIGVATNPTLNPAAANYKWTDQGLVLQSGSANNYNCIDPDMFVDSGGKVWLAFGSFWSGIKMIAIDPSTGKQLASNTTIYSLASRGGGAIEGASLMQHGGYYYLFTSWDTCCQGVSSTYNTRVGRSASVTGPYVDEAGTALMSSGGTELLSSYAQYIGPGGGDAFPDGRRTYFAHHYYDGNHSGNPYLQVREIVFDNNGWCQITQPYLGRHEAFEAEHAHLANVAVSQTASASNADYVTGITTAGSQVLFYVNALAAGNYEAVLRYANTGGTATQLLTVDGSAPLTVSYPSTGATLQFSATQAVTANVALVEGYNTLLLQPGTGSVALDRMDLLRTAGQWIPAGSDDHECSVTFQAAPDADVFSPGGDAQYENIDFGTGGYKSIAVSFFGGCTGPLTFTLDSLTGTQVAVTNLSIAGAQTLVLPLPAALQTTTGVHDLFAQFNGSGGCSIGGFQFSTLLSGTTATPTVSPTASRTASLTPTFSMTPSASSTPTRTLTSTSTYSATPTSTASASPTRTASVTPSATASNTASGTPTRTLTSTSTYSATPTPTASASPTRTASATPSSTASNTASRTPTVSMTPTLTASLTASFTSSATLTVTRSATATPTSPPTLTVTRTNSPTASPSSSDTAIPSSTPTASTTFTRTSTASATATASSTRIFTASPTPSPTATYSLTATPSSTPSGTPLSTATGTATSSPTWTASFTITASPTSTSTPTSTLTLSPTSSSTPTASRTVSFTSTSSPTFSASPTFSSSMTGTPTLTPATTRTETPTNTLTATPSSTPTGTASATATPSTTASSTSSPQASRTPTASLTATDSTTPTPSPTGTPSATPTATCSVSSTPTSSPTLTLTRTNTPADTSTATVTASRSPSPSLTMMPSSTPTSSPTATPVVSGTAVVFPNPAKGTGPVTLRFTLSAPASRVEIRVFTTAFRLVNAMTLDNVPEGIQEVALPLTDRWGKPLANGLYYVWVKTPQGHFVVKLLLAR